MYGSPGNVNDEGEGHVCGGLGTHRGRGWCKTRIEFTVEESLRTGPAEVPTDIRVVEIKRKLLKGKGL